MSNPDEQMTRSDMQTEALTIENLIVTAMSMNTNKDHERAFSILEMAQESALKLNAALDSANAPRGMK